MCTFSVSWIHEFYQEVFVQESRTGREWRDECLRIQRLIWGIPEEKISETQILSQFSLCGRMVELRSQWTTIDIDGLLFFRTFASAAAAIALWHLRAIYSLAVFPVSSYLQKLRRYAISIATSLEKMFRIRYMTCICLYLIVQKDVSIARIEMENVDRSK